MCTLIHNVLNTDFVILIKDEETVQGVKIFHDGAESLVKLGVDRDFALSLRDLFGPSGICNVLGAIKLAKFLRLGPGDNVVTVATDGFDRYNSVLDEMNIAISIWRRRCWTAGRTTSFSARRRPRLRLPQAAMKERLFQAKGKRLAEVRLHQGISRLDAQPGFWDAQYAKVQEYNQKICAAAAAAEEQQPCSSSR
jgi:cysteine synthase